MLSQRIICVRSRDLRSPILSLVRKRTTATAASTKIDTNENINVSGKPFEEIPGPTGIQSWNKIGSRFLFYPFTKYKIETLHKLFDTFHDKYGKIVRFQLGSWAVLVSDIDDITSVFKNDTKYPVRRTFPLIAKYFERNKATVSPTLAILNGQEWMDVRSAIQTKISKPNSATYYLPVQNIVTDQFVQILKDKDFSAEELRTHFFKYACESIGVVCFNKRLGCFEDPSTERGAATAKFIQNVHDTFYLTHRSMGKLPLYNLYPTKLFLKYEAALNGLHQEGLIHVNNALAEIEKKKKDGTLDLNEPNFLRSLLSENRLTIPQIVSITLDLFNGGTDSTAKNLAWNLYHLANNKDKQDRLYEEIKNVLGTETEIKAEHINKMSYLQASLKETFRLTFPTLCGTSRVLDHDIILSGYNIPKGTIILTNNRRAVLDEDVINQPFKYMPERWLRDKSGKRVNDIPTMALLPFGFGVRNCPGRRFAEMEIYLAVAKIVQNLEVTLAPGSKHPDVEYHTFATPSHALDLKFKHRH
ncbi:hypothetical protein SNE40_019078 [Patella caerulea]|uniref:Cytochrome P450 n=1 Tax=Patella caerulea TaxID=87958 RepID=A0AAN8J7Z2_PATCE